MSRWSPFRAAALIGPALLLVSGLGGCASNEVPEPTVAPAPMDMSGHWEVDYAYSDNLQARYAALMRQVREEGARRQLAAERGRPMVASGGSSAEAVVALAQMAELVTGSQLLEVEQDRVSIRIEREGNFSLSCDYGSGGVVRNDYGVGRETCFWDGSQLVFHIELPEGLDIEHRLAVAADGQSLGIVTRLYSSAVSAPFSLRRIYRRYEPGKAGYRCTETLTRGRVCTTESE